MVKITFLNKIILLIVILNISMALIIFNAFKSTDEQKGDITYHASEYFNESFYKSSIPLIDYSVAKEDIDTVIRTASMDIDHRNIVGLLKYKENNIILIDSGETVTEIISDNRKEILAIHNLTPKFVNSKEFLKTEPLDEKTKIEIFELDILTTNISNAETLRMNIIVISHEYWNNIVGCVGKDNIGQFMKGKYYFDSSKNLTVIGNSYTRTNCILLSNTEISTNLQSGTASGALYSKVKWESKGFPVTSQIERISGIIVDNQLNINIWREGDSWVGFGFNI